MSETTDPIMESIIDVVMHDFSYITDIHFEKNHLCLENIAKLKDIYSSISEKKDNFNQVLGSDENLTRILSGPKSAREALELRDGEGNLVDPKGTTFLSDMRSLREISGIFIKLLELELARRAYDLLKGQKIDFKSRKLQMYKFVRETDLGLFEVDLSEIVSKDKIESDLKGMYQVMELQMKGKKSKTQAKMKEIWEEIRNDRDSIRYLKTAFQKGYVEGGFQKVIDFLDDIETFDEESPFVCHYDIEETRYSIKSKIKIDLLKLRERLSESDRGLFRRKLLEHGYKKKIRTTLKKLSNEYLDKKEYGYSKTITGIILSGKM